MNRVSKNIYTTVILTVLILALVLFASCTKNENNTSTTPSATISVDHSDDNTSFDDEVTIQPTNDIVQSQDEYYYYEDDIHDEEEVLTILPVTATPTVSESLKEETPVVPVTPVAQETPIVEEVPVVEEPVADTPLENIPVTLPLVNDEYPVEVGPFVGADDVLVENKANSGIKHTFMFSIDPYALSLLNNDFSGITTLQPYGFNAFLEYRLHLAKYLFVGFGVGAEYYTGSDSYTNVPFLFKAGFTAPLTSALSLDTYAIAGAELNTYFRDYTAFTTGAGFDFAYSFTDNIALALGFEYRYSKAKSVTNTDITLHRFIVPTISFAYSI